MTAADLPAEKVAALTRAVLGRICNVSNLPDWMQVPALGRDMRPLADLTAEALAPLIAGWLGEASRDALRLVRQVESDMAQQAADAWRSADARRGLSDQDALLVHADTLTRWSERFRMAFDGDDYLDGER